MTVSASSCTATKCSYTWTPANKYILRLSDVVTVVASNGLSITVNPAAPTSLAVAELHYGSGKSTVGAGSDEASFLDEVAQLVKDNGYLNVKFVGYTDDDGSAAANQTLSTTRATNASNYLKNALAKLGVTNVNLTAVGKGISTTYGSGCSVNGATDACAKNRRVSVEVSGQQSAPARPAAPTVTAQNANVKVVWTAPANNGLAITSYTVYYTTSDDYDANGAPLSTDSADLGNWTVYCTATKPNCTEADPQAVVNDTAYVFVVVATNAKGTSQVSAVSDPVTPTLMAPGAPGVAVSLVTKTGLTIAVTAPTDDGGSTITGYAYTVSRGTTVVKSGSIEPGTPVAVTGLSANVTYTVSVTATNAIGTSDDTTKTVTTLK